MQVATQVRRGATRAATSAAKEAQKRGVRSPIDLVNYVGAAFARAISEAHARARNLPGDAIRVGGAGQLLVHGAVTEAPAMQAGLKGGARIAHKAARTVSAVDRKRGTPYELQLLAHQRPSAPRTVQAVRASTAPQARALRGTPCFGAVATRAPAQAAPSGLGVFVRKSPAGRAIATLRARHWDLSKISRSAAARVERLRGGAAQLARLTRDAAPTRLHVGATPSHITRRGFFLA